MQHLDLDIYFEQWNPPSTLIDKSALPGAPHHGVGRPCKVGKEEIVGLLTALQLFVAEDSQVRRMRWRALMDILAASLEGINASEVRLVDDRKRAEIPAVHLVLDEAALGFTALDLVRRLQDGEPSITR